MKVILFYDIYVKFFCELSSIFINVEKYFKIFLLLFVYSHLYIDIKTLSNNLM